MISGSSNYIGKKSIKCSTNITQDIIEKYNLTYSDIQIDRQTDENALSFSVEVTSLSVIEIQLFFWETWNILDASWIMWMHPRSSQMGPTDWCLPGRQGRKYDWGRRALIPLRCAGRCCLETDGESQSIMHLRWWLPWISACKATYN